jgi:hypothetical protein
LLSLPAAADYAGFKAAITKQLSPINAGDDAVVELVTVIPKQYELKFKSLDSPQGVVFKNLQSPGDCGIDDKHCRQRFTMAVDAWTTHKCNLTGNYVAHFDVACAKTKDSGCKPGTHDVAFSLTSENFCAVTSVDTSAMWQQAKGLFAGDVGAGGGDMMWFLDAQKSVAGGLDVISLSLNSTGGMRRAGGAVRIDVDDKGNGFVANDQGVMFRYDSGKWTRLPGNPARDVGIGANGTAWYIGSNKVPGGFGIYRWNDKSKGWDDMKGGAVRIDVDPSGNAWVVNDAGAVFRYDGSGWVNVSGVQARDVGVGGNGSVFVAGSDGAVYKRDGTAWKKRGGSNITDITVSTKGVPIGINAAHEIWMGQP